MAKYNKKTVNKIIELLSSDTYTVKEVCKIVGITTKSFHEWRATKPEFDQMVVEAENDRMEAFAVEAKKSMLKKLRGYEVTETKVTTVPGKKGLPTIKEQKTYKKHIAPDTAAIIFTLTNGDPEHWKNRQTNEITGKNGGDLFKGITDEELDKRIADLQKKLNDAE